MNKIVFTLSLFLLFGQLTACRKIVSKAIEETTKSVNQAESSEHNATVEKMNAYVGALNRVSEPVNSSYENYVKWCNPETGPTGKERNPYFNAIHEITNTYITKIKEVQDKEPKMAEIEAAGKNYVTAFEMLYPKAAEAAKYYDQKDYKDDKFDKGKKMHAELIAAYKSFQKADNELHIQYEKLNEIQTEALLKTLKDEGQELRYRTTAATKHAKRLLNEINKSYEKSEFDRSKMKVDSLKADIDTYAKIIEDIREYTKQNPEAAKKELGTFGESGLRTYLSSSDDFLVSSKELFRKVRDKEKIPTYSKAEMNQGTPEHALKQYNRLIDNSNTWLNR
jgi:hypothetical protein